MVNVNFKKRLKFAFICNLLECCNAEMLHLGEMMTMVDHDILTYHVCSWSTMKYNNEGTVGTMDDHGISKISLQHSDGSA